MPATVGARLSGSWRGWAALGIAGVVVAADLLWHPIFADLRRAGAGVLGAVLILGLARGDRMSLGLRLRPVQGYGYWIKASLVVGALLGVLIVVAAAVMYAVGKPFATRSMFVSTSQFRPVALHAVVVAPLLEEPIYRLVVCVPIIALFGRWPAVVASGGLFGYLHFHYGNPAPDNFFAGYVLAWAYLHSRSLAVPIALHALGNGLVIAGNIGAFYLL